MLCRPDPYVAEIAATIIFFLKLHLRDQGIKGHITGEAGGYKISGERYAPDVAFISSARQPELARSGYNPDPSELAVEVISPTDPEGKLILKVANYLAAGTLVWLVWPVEKQVHVYAPGQPVQVLGIDRVLDGGDVLPDFKLPVRALFKSTQI